MNKNLISKCIEKLKSDTSDSGIAYVLGMLEALMESIPSQTPSTQSTANSFSTPSVNSDTPKGAKNVQVGPPPPGGTVLQKPTIPADPRTGGSSWL